MSEQIKEQRQYDVDLIDALVSAVSDDVNAYERGQGRIHAGDVTRARARLIDRLGEVRAALEAAQKDSARLDAMQEQRMWTTPPVTDADWSVSGHVATSLREAIDAAIAGARPQEEESRG